MPVHSHPIQLGLMEEVALSVRDLSITSIRGGFGNPAGGRHNVHLDLKLGGALTIRGLGFYQNGDGNYSLDTTVCRPRLFATPATYQAAGMRVSRPLLDEVILGGLIEGLDRLIGGTRGLFQVKFEELPSSLGPWVPEKWEGRKLVIPIHRIQLTAIEHHQDHQSQRTCVIGSIEIGGQFAWIGTRIVDNGSPVPVDMLTIEDAAVRDRVSHVLFSKKVRQALARIENDIANHHHFILAPPRVGIHTVPRPFRFE